MAFGFVRSCCELCFLAVITWTYVSCFPGGSGLTSVRSGSSITFTCPGSSTQNYTFIFLIVNANGHNRIAKNTPNLTITNAKPTDGGTYSCEVKNQTGHLIGGKQFGILFILPEIIYVFTMFPKIPSSVVDEGVRFEFRCEFSQAKTKITWWKFDETHKSKKIEIPRQNISVKFDGNKRIESYVFRKVTIKDSGAYQCGVMVDGKSKVTDPRALQVIKNRLPTIEDVKEVFITKEGERNFKVSLSISGSPFPNVTFLKEGKEIISCPAKKFAEHQNGISCRRGNYEISVLSALIITKVYYPEHDGKYSCVATNIIGSVNFTFTIKVTVPPTIYRKDGDIIYAEENKKANVTCLVRKANPKPTFNWYSQDLLQINDVPTDKWNPSNLPETSIELDDGKHKSTLTIPSNHGNSFYRCNATNSMAVDSRDYKFIRFALRRKTISSLRKKNQLANANRTAYLDVLYLTPTPSECSGMSTGTVIGIVIGVIVFVLIVAFLGLLWQRSELNNKKCSFISTNTS